METQRPFPQGATASKTDSESRQTFPVSEQDPATVSPSSSPASPADAAAIRRDCGDRRLGLLNTASSAGIFLLLLTGAVYFARDLLLPIVAAVLLSLLLDPVTRFLQKLRIPRTLSALLLLAGFLALSALAVQRALIPAQEWLKESPALFNQLEERVQRLLKPVEEVTEAARQVEKLTQMQSRDSEPQAVEVETQPRLEALLFTSTQSFLTNGGILLILTFFLLSSGPRQMGKIARLLPRGSARARFLTAARRVQLDLSIHLLTITVINLLLGTCVALVCFLAGLPNPVLWGLLAAVLNFIPYLGAAIGTFILAGAALLTFDNLWTAFALPVAYMCLTALEGTVVTPIILGQRLSLNPIAILLALLFWGFLWGLPGALLAVPLLVAAKAVCSHLDELAPLTKLLA